VYVRLHVDVPMIIYDEAVSISWELIMHTLSITTLRQNLFKIVDEIISTGQPVMIERKGNKVLLSLEQQGSKLSNLRAHDCIVGDPNEIVDMEMTEWNEPDKL